MSCVQCYVHVVSRTCRVCGTVYTLYSGVEYMWRCVHVVQATPCTCDVVHMLCRWCSVQVVLCTCCTYGIGVCMVLCACRRCCVIGMQYYVCELCSHRIVVCVLVVLYSMQVHALGGISHRVQMDALYCIHWVWVYVLYVKCRCMYSMVLYVVCGCMYVTHTMCMCTWLRRRNWVFVVCPI